MLKVVRNERGAIILFTMLVSIIIFLLMTLLLDGGIILHYRHQLQTVADAGSTAGINKASTYLTDENERVIDPEVSVRNAFQLMHTNLSGIAIDTYKNDGTIASDGTEKPNYMVIDMTATPLSDIEFETKIHGRVRSFFAPMLRMDPYTDVHVISRTKLIPR